MVFEKFKKGFSDFMGKDNGDFGEEYIEIDVGKKDEKRKILVRPFVLKKFEEVNDILNALREGYSIAVIDISQLRKRDIIELKRAIAKIKKTSDALEGSIAGFGENTIIVTPSFAKIHKETAHPKEEKKPEYY